MTTRNNRKRSKPSKDNKSHHNHLNIRTWQCESFEQYNKPIPLTANQAIKESCLLIG